MKKILTTCDKCDREIRGGQERYEAEIKNCTYTMHPFNFDLCSECFSNLIKWFSEKEE